ncbi:hydantoinase/oxoprolinase N-terminal domain-containing protein [Mangrovicoccus ximenensis]|uniref:hydantoinase/oxoprolinase N-terminal domain-containing protein n=1 Tax=Mangrovicoccus ximenensis TaxID=1911570 RepID=UPI000D34340F|nr:hydantoinase/oxoprolinase family protein [Mangrovicoccus ximenensis]
MTETAKSRLAIDIGGTFTDFILEDAGGELHSFKTLTTHEDYTRAIGTGIDRLLSVAGVAPAEVGQVLHATTLGSNTLLERTGAKTGLITTKGFRDVLEIRDLRMPRLYDQDWDKPETLVRRRWRRVAEGRMLADGTEMAPLSENDIREAVAFLKAGGITSVAVCLINSYANPAHEIRAGEIIRELWPEVHLSLSHELLPEEGEYPRTSTCVINAYVQPVFKDYIARLKGLIAGRGIAAPLFFMQSNGGLTPAETAAEQPIHIIESGPAAGVVGASILGAATGTETMITLDIGGTTAKAALVQDGRPGMATEFQVGGHVLQTERLLSGGGFSLRVPAIDLAAFRTSKPNAIPLRVERPFCGALHSSIPRSRMAGLKKGALILGATPYVPGRPLSALFALTVALSRPAGLGRPIQGGADQAPPAVTACAVTPPGSAAVPQVPFSWRSRGTLRTRHPRERPERATSGAWGIRRDRQVQPLIPA